MHRAAARTTPGNILLPQSRHEFGSMETLEGQLFMRLCTLIRLPIFAIAILAAPPAGAQLYKWVDERGVTNYSNQPPADPRLAQRVAPVADSLSVYSPDEALLRDMASGRQDRDRVAAERKRALEIELKAERLARERATASQARSTLDACVNVQSIGCTNVSPDIYYPYVAPVARPRARHRSKRIDQIRLPPGATAGQVVGPTGFIPGQSASARPPSAPPSRPVYENVPNRGPVTR